MEEERKGGFICVHNQFKVLHCIAKMVSLLL